MEKDSDSIVDRVYGQLKAMTVSFELKPAERINEGDFAKRLGVSRTPLREALNRLKTEGFLRFEPGKGFFCRAIDAREIFDLYELRKSIEVAAVRFAVKRAKVEDIDALLAFLEATGPEPGDRTSRELVDLDETFHERLMAMSANKEMLRVLQNVNARIRFVRWTDIDRDNRSSTQIEHRAILLAVRERDADEAARVLQKHIDRRLDQINASIRESFAQIYMPSASTAVD
ncbi:GntR family transcriptional regulator [Leptospira interrogans]